MRNWQVQAFFVDKEHVPTHATDRLIDGGYLQPDRSEGYTRTARRLGVEPTQYWHLMQSWCANSAPEDRFTRTIQCGELLVWMPEVSGAVPDDELESLVTDMLAEPTNRRRGNALALDVCFDAIVRVVEKAVPEEAPPEA